jgi:hypothetical protein
VNVELGAQSAAAPANAVVDKAGLRLQAAQDRLQVHRVGRCWCRNPTSRTMLFSRPPRPALGDEVAGGTSSSIPRRELHDERRTRRDFTPTDHAEEPPNFMSSSLLTPFGPAVPGRTGLPALLISHHTTLARWCSPTMCLNLRIRNQYS